jgi:hypothetical protein
MRCLVFLALCAACARASVKKAYDPCRCHDYVKFDNGAIWDRVNCCVPWIPRPAVEDLVKVDGIVYRRVNASYEQYSAFVVKQVEFPGEDSVLYNPDNQYTNLSCLAFSCRSASVYRNGSNHTCGGGLYPNGDCVEYDDPRDWFAPLCHNSTASKCVIWLPIDEITGGGWLTMLLVVVPVGGVFLLVALVYSAWGSICRSDDQDSGECIDLAMTLTWWVFMFVLTLVSVIALCRFNEWLASTQVDMDFVTYQTCIKECSQVADRSIDIAAVNQCDDRGVSCGGSMSTGSVVSCRSCQSHRSDWLNMVVFCQFLWAIIIYQWAAFFLYVLAIKARATWNSAIVWALLLPPLGVFIACALLTSTMALCGVHGLSAYFVPQGLASVHDIGLCWTICMCVWWAVFTLGKCIAVGRKALERRETRAVHASSVVCFCRQ